MDLASRTISLKIQESGASSISSPCYHFINKLPRFLNSMLLHCEKWFTGVGTLSDVDEPCIENKSSKKQNIYCRLLQAHRPYDCEDLNLSSEAFKQRFPILLSSISTSSGKQTRSFLHPQIIES